MGVVMDAQQQDAADVLVVIGLAFMLGVSLAWFNWSRGIITGTRVGIVNKRRPPKLVGRVTIISWLSTLFLVRLWGGNVAIGSWSRLIADASFVISIELFLLWIGFWILVWKRRIGKRNPRSGDGLIESDFEPLIRRLINIKVRTDLMLFGSVALGAIWWTHFAFGSGYNDGLTRVSDLCGELSLGMSSLGIIALLSLASDAYQLRFAGLARLQFVGTMPRLAHRICVAISKFGSSMFVGLIGIWTIWVYFRSPVAPYDIFVLSIPLGLIWESAGSNRSSALQK
jgi:hypothetical protein